MQSNLIKGLLNFFRGSRDEGMESPCPSSQSGTEKPPVMFTHTANLDHLKVLPFNEPTSCYPKYIVLQCNCDRKIVPSSCMALDCTVCRDYVIKRRSNSVFHRLMEPVPGQRLRYNRKTIIYTVFTVPLEVRERYLDPKVWSRLRRKVWRLLKDGFGGLYGMEASHPVGDKDPTLFHPHFNFLWVQKGGHRPFLDVDLLREKWARLLGVDVVDVKTKYSDNVRLIKHWTNYVTRTFPGNSKWSGRIVWYGKYPRKKPVAKVICPFCGSKYKRIGWLYKWQVDQYYEQGFKWGVDPPWENDKSIQKDKSSGCCCRKGDNA